SVAGRRAERTRRRTAHVPTRLAAAGARDRLRLPPRVVGRSRRAGAGERPRRRGAVPVPAAPRAAVRRRGAARVGDPDPAAHRIWPLHLLLLQARGQADGTTVRATSARAPELGSGSPCRIT